METILILAIFGLFVATIKQWPRSKLISLWAVAVTASLLIFVHYATFTFNLNF